MSVDVHPITILEGEVRELVRRRGVDPVRDRAAVDQLVRDAVADYETRSTHGVVVPLVDPVGAGRAVVDAVAGLGPLQQYLDDPRVEEIWINSPTQVFVARDGEPELTTTILTSAQVRDLVEQMLRSSGRRLDLSSPFVDAALPGGERLHVVIPDDIPAWVQSVPCSRGNDTGEARARARRVRLHAAVLAARERGPRREGVEDRRRDRGPRARALRVHAPDPGTSRRHLHRGRVRPGRRRPRPLPHALQPVGPDRVDRRRARGSAPAREDALPARSRVHPREHDRVPIGRAPPLPHLPCGCRSASRLG